MPRKTAAKSDYRPCVGIVLFNTNGKVWMGQRAGASGSYVWQFPQGGIDTGESPRFASLRELYEETGISVQSISPLGRNQGWLYYDFPEGHGSARMQKWRGQRQRWYAYRYHGHDKDFVFDLHGSPEFTAFKWVDLAQTANLIVPFKRKVYEHLADEFAPFAKPVK